jgi:hypothetical protein
VEIISARDENDRKGSLKLFPVSRKLTILEISLFSGDIDTVLIAERN